MNIYKYCFKIADLTIEITSPASVSFSSCMDSFLVLPSEKADLFYDIEWITEVPLVREEIYKNEYSIYYDNGYIRKKELLAAGKIQSVYLYSKGLKTHYRLQVPKSLLENGRLFDSVNLIYFLALEEGLLEKNAFILHSSFVSWQGKGILFTAPSGTGKSTQAELWRLYENAEVYNGDRTVIRKIDDIYHGFGSPFAGSSGIYRNETSPIQAIIVLTQAPENHIERLTGKNAFLPLYRETLMNTWNPAYMEKMADLLMDVTASVPVYHLACRPDRSAVELVKESLF